MSCGDIGFGPPTQQSDRSPSKNNPIGLDLFDKIPDVKREFLKFCKHFEARLSRNVAKHRVIAKNEEECTDIMIPGFIMDKSTRGAKKLSPSKINLQFLEHHKIQFLGLHRDLAKISYSPQTDAALTNFKTLLELEISLLMGCDIEWGGGSDAVEPQPAAAAGTVLGAAGATDDNDNSSNERGGEAGAFAEAAGPANGAASAAACAANSAVDGGVGTGMTKTFRISFTLDTQNQKSTEVAVHRAG